MNMVIKNLLLYLIFYIVLNGQDISVNLIQNKICVEKIQKHISYLGSDELEGRGTGTRGGDLAADYLAKEFSNYELIPLGNNNSYYQYIQLHGSTPKESSRLTLFDKNDNQYLLNLNEEYILLNLGDQTYIPTPLPLIFAGYGISAPEFDYNDYQSIDVEGKIVAVLDGEPLSDNEDYFDGVNPTIYSFADAKKRLAISKGARGIIIIPNLDDNPYFDWEWINQNSKFENVQLAYAVTSNLSLLFNPLHADKLFMASPFSIADIYQMHRNHRVISFPLQTKIRFKGEFDRRDFIAPNILGMIKGSDEKLNDTYIVLSAHYDHLGIGVPVDGDSIYNGVFDNAAGVAALLEIASVISSMEKKPRRSIIFALFTGEEKGLLGSRYYIDHSPVPLYKTVANINIDGVASFDKFKSVVGIGSEYSTLEKFLKRTASAFENDLTITDIPSIFKKTDAYISSDQITFARAGIPSVLIFEGLDYDNITNEEGIEKFIEYGTKYYHTPKDDLSLPINFEAFVQHTKFIMNFLLTLANSEEEPEWYSFSPYLNIRLRSIAERK